MRKSTNQAILNLIGNGFSQERWNGIANLLPDINLCPDKNKFVVEGLYPMVI